MKYANRIGARFSFIVGDNEMESGEVVIKDMDNGERETIKIDEVAEYIKARPSV